MQTHPPRWSPLELPGSPRVLAVALLLVSSLSAQVRPVDPGTGPVNPGGGAAGGGAAGGGGAAVGGGGVIGGGQLPGGGVQLPGLGGGAGASQDPTIVAPRGGLVGDTLTASALIPNQAAAAGGAAGANTATYQWTITGGRITSDPRTNPVQFVADGAGTVILSATIITNGTSYNPAAQVSILSPETAGSITAPATVATNVASITASVPPATANDRTFRWTVSGDAAILSGQGTATVTLRPGTPGPKQLVCNVTLQGLATVPVRSYLVVTGSGAPTTVTIANGNGSGTYPAGSRLDIFADPPPAGQVFDRWTGNTEALGTAAILASLPHTQLTVPATPVTLTATYKPVAPWTLTTIQNFNPQTQTGANAATTTVTTTLAYHVPANATGLVFLLHDSGESAADWFNQPERVLLARDLVAAGYGVAALNSINRNTGAWSAQALLANNLDARNHAAALDRIVADGAIMATKPVFFLGVATGANAALRIADLLSTGANARPVKGAVLYLASGNEALAVTSRVPQFFALAANDEDLGPAGLTSARDNSQLLVGRGVATTVISNAASPVHSGRFRVLGVNSPTFTAVEAQTVWNAVKNAGMIDANNYPKSVPPMTAITAALPAALQPRARDVRAQLAVASAASEFYSDANPRIINFLNTRAADGPVPAPGRLVNLSTRSKIAYLGDTFAVGFNLSGTQNATLLIRGIGPALAKFGVSGALLAPRLEVNRGPAVIAANEGWNTAANAAQIATTAASVGAFALAPGDLDSAVLISLAPGSYTATIKGVNGSTGDALAEIYDVTRNGTRLTNLSTLARINAPGDLLIPGIVIAGNNPRTLTIRAVAQGLSDFGLSADSLLGDPLLSVLSGTQVVNQNNNWAQAGAATLTAAFPAVGAFPLRAAADAALVDALAPGSYTLQAGAAPVGAAAAANPPNQTGAVLVEVYEIP